jgi:hypothetical protein
MIIGWVGGTGRYQLQSVSAIGKEWQNEGGILTTNSVVVTPSGSNGFYRVIALPQ